MALPPKGKGKDRGKGKGKGKQGKGARFAGKGRRRMSMICEDGTETYWDEDDEEDDNVDGWWGDKEEQQADEGSGGGNSGMQQESSPPPTQPSTTAPATEGAGSQPVVAGLRSAPRPPIADASPKAEPSPLTGMPRAVHWSNGGIAEPFVDSNYRCISS